MSDRAAKLLAKGAFASVSVGASAWCITYGHDTAAIWMFVLAFLVIA